MSTPAKPPKYDHQSAVDFVVIGGGGAGGVVAKELSTAGFQVVVLEQGPYIRPEEFVHDELRFRNAYISPQIGREVLTNDHSVQPNTFRHGENEKAVRQPSVVYGKCMGGGTVHFTANYWRFHEIEFHRAQSMGSNLGDRFCRLAYHLCRSRAVLRQS